MRGLMGGGLGGFGGPGGLGGGLASMMPSRGTMLRMGVGGLAAYGGLHVLGKLAAQGFTAEMLAPAPPESCTRILADPLMAELAVVLQKASYYDEADYVTAMEYLNDFLELAALAQGPPGDNTARSRVRPIVKASNAMRRANRHMERLQRAVPHYEVRLRVELDEIVPELQGQLQDMLQNLRLHLN